MHVFRLQLHPTSPPSLRLTRCAEAAVCILRARGRRPQRRAAAAAAPGHCSCRRCKRRRLWCVHIPRVSRVYGRFLQGVARFSTAPPPPSQRRGYSCSGFLGAKGDKSLRALQITITFVPSHSLPLLCSHCSDIPSRSSACFAAKSRLPTPKARRSATASASAFSASTSSNLAAMSCKTKVSALNRGYWRACSAVLFHLQSASPGLRF